MLSNQMKGTSPRIALISGGLSLGGSTTFLLNLAGELIRREIPVLIGSLEADNPHAEDFRRLNIPVHVEDDRTRIFEDRMEGLLIRLRDFRPDVVIACLGPSSFEVLRYVPLGVRRLGMIQSDYPENYPPFAPYVPYLDGMVGVSGQIEMNLRNHPEFGQVPSYSVLHGVAIPEGGSCGKWPRAGDSVRILYLGRLEQPQKRVRVFPQILEQLAQSDLPFEWTIAGDGPEREWLHEHLPAQAGKARVHFAGAVNYREVPALLRAHDIFLLASAAEGLPVSLLEAMAYGLVPVVSHLPSGISEVVDQTSGILVPKDRVEGYAEAMIWLAQHPEESVVMANRAVEVVRENYSVAAMADRWLALLEQSSSTGHSAKWPVHFPVQAPLGASYFRFSPPVRMLRRWWLQHSPRGERQPSNPG
jgi:colanic acid/amylovoran biosynthesis glycosyltransferase